MIFLLLDKIPHRSSLRKKGFILAHQLRVQSVMVGKAAGTQGSQSQAGSRGMNDDAQLMCSFSFRTSAHRYYCSYRVGFSMSIHPT